MLLLFAILILLSFASASHAIVPGMWPFLQSLSSFLPQILLFVMVGVSAVFKFSAWKRGLAWMGRKVRTKAGVSVAVVVVILMGLSVYILFRGSGSVVDQIPTGGKAEWTAFRGGILRLGSVDNSNGPQDGQEIWSFREKLDRAGFASSPAVVGKRVYVGADNDNLYCFNAENGDVVWKFEALYEVFSSPAISNGKVYFGEGLHYTEDATFHCVDANTGEEVWSFPTTSHVESSPTVIDGKVIFGAGDDGVYCLDASTGNKLWQYPSVHVDGSPAVYDNRVYFGSGYGRSAVYCIDLANGNEIWSVDTQHPAWGAPTVWEGKMYIGTGAGNFAASIEEPSGSILCLDIKTGETVWESKIGGTVLGAVAIDDGKAYVGCRDAKIYCFDVSTGNEIWTSAAGSGIVSSPAVANGDVYFGSDDGKIYCLDAEDGISKWEFNTSESGLFNMDSRIIGSPTISNGRLYVGSMNFFFYCIGDKEDSL